MQGKEARPPLLVRSVLLDKLSCIIHMQMRHPANFPSAHLFSRKCLCRVLTVTHQAAPASSFDYVDLPDCRSRYPTSDEEYYMCSGILVAPNAILTTARCLQVLARAWLQQCLAVTCCFPLN